MKELVLVILTCLVTNGWWVINTREIPGDNAGVVFLVIFFAVANIILGFLILDIIIRNWRD